MVATKGGTIIASHPGTSDLLEFDRAGNLLRSSPTGLTECHGITIVDEGDTEYLWIADIGLKSQKTNRNGGFESRCP